MNSITEEKSSIKVLYKNLQVIQAPLAPQTWGEQVSKSPKFGGFRGPEQPLAIPYPLPNLNLHLLPTASLIDKITAKDKGLLPA